MRWRPQTRDIHLNVTTTYEFQSFSSIKTRAPMRAMIRGVFLRHPSKTKRHKKKWELNPRPLVPEQKLLVFVKFSFFFNNLIAVGQTLRNQGFTDEGQSGPGNSRSAPLPSLALGPWETVYFLFLMSNISIPTTFREGGRWAKISEVG